MPLYRGEFKCFEIFAAVQGTIECTSMSGPSPHYNSCIPRHVLPCDFNLSCFHAVKCVERLKHKVYLANWLNLASFISTRLLFIALLPAVVVQINISLAIS